MISLISQDKFNKSVTLFGLSTDTKPSGSLEYGAAVVPIKNASLFYEIDSGDLFIFDEENEEWVKQG